MTVYHDVGLTQARLGGPLPTIIIIAMQFLTANNFFSIV